MEQLPKTKDSRFSEVETFRCRANEIHGLVSLKTADGASDFVHVIRSRLDAAVGDIEGDLVVKIHQADQLFVVRELDALKRLQGWDNAVQYLCDFECSDQESRWHNQITKQTRFCNQKGDALIFIVMEYIANGDVSMYVSRANAKELKALFVQSGLAIAELAYRHKLYHGDLNSGNILVAKTNNKRHTYTVDGKLYTVKTHGIVPKLIDFGRGGQYASRPSSREVKDDILTLYSVLVTWVQDPQVKAKIKNTLVTASKDKKLSLFDVINTII